MFKQKEICPAPNCGLEFKTDTQDYYWHLMTHEAKKKLEAKPDAKNDLTVDKRPERKGDAISDMLKAFGIVPANLNGLTEIEAHDPNSKDIIKIHLEIFVDARSHRIVAIESKIK